LHVLPTAARSCHRQFAHQLPNSPECERWFASAVRNPQHRIAIHNSDIMQPDQKLIRTQIYLTPAQQKRLALASRGAAVNKSELIRRAVDQLLDQQPTASPAGKAQRLSSIAGLWAGREDMADPSAYVRQLRVPRF
jgi:Ribbon-helix-helix domain